MDERKQAILIREAIHELGIDVPIVTTRVVGDRVELYLYGGRVVLYPPENDAVRQAELKTSPEMLVSPSPEGPSVSPETAGFEDGRPSPEKAGSSIGDLNHPAVRDLESWPSASLQGMNLAELRKLAKRKQIASAGKMTKKQVIQALREKR